jgi:hypothetical protein
MDRKGYLLIEIIFGLSLFALVAGVVTQGFLIGLKLYRDAGTDSNEAVITMLLINRIKKATSGATTSIKLNEEEWQVRIENASELAKALPGLWALNINVAKIKDSKGNNVQPLEEKKYNIFRYLP